MYFLVGYIDYVGLGWVLRVFFKLN